MISYKKERILGGQAGFRWTMPRWIPTHLVTWVKVHISIYRKLPKISPGAYIFQRPFLRSLFLEGLIFGGAYVRREICVWKLIGLACSGKEIYHFCFGLLCIRGEIPSTSSPGGGGGLIFGGAIWRRVLCVTIFGGLYLEGLIFGILRCLGKFMTKSIKLNLYSEFILTFTDPCKILQEIENKLVQFLLCFTSRMW